MAAIVANGDFETGDFTAWQLDSDGEPGTDRSFSVVAAGGGHAGRIDADFHESPGDVASPARNDSHVAGTLVHELDLTIPSEGRLVLSFDWVFEGEDLDPAAREIFSVGLNDGNGVSHGADGLLGHLISPTTTYGSGTFSTALNRAVFNSAPDWSIGVQLVVGVSPDALEPNGFGSYVEIDNVKLEATPTGVPGDATSDGAVNGADYTVWADHFG